MGNRSTASKKRRILLVVRWPVGGIRTFLRYVYRVFDPKLWHFTIIAPQNSELEALSVDLEDCDVELVVTSSRPSALEFDLTIFKQLPPKEIWIWCIPTDLHPLFVQRSLQGCC